MIRNWNWKQWVQAGLVTLVVVNIGLILWNWQLRQAAPEVQRRQLDLLRQQHTALGDDVRTALGIRTRMPEVEKECDRFLTEQLLPLAGGYSSIVEDLNGITSRSGLTARGVSYKQKELEPRGVAEVQVVATVEGGYANLVKFINELERSKHFYLLEELGLAEATSGDSIRLNVKLKTYFRLKA